MRYQKSDEEIFTLTKTGRKEISFSGRVGVSTEKWKLALAIDVVAKKKKKKIENITEEVPRIDDVTYDISMEEMSHKMTQD